MNIRTLYELVSTIFHLSSAKEANSMSLDKQSGIVWKDEYYLSLEHCKKSGCQSLVHVSWWATGNCVKGWVLSSTWTVWRKQFPVASPHLLMRNQASYEKMSTIFHLKSAKKRCLLLVYNSWWAIGHFMEGWVLSSTWLCKRSNCMLLVYISLVLIPKVNPQSVLSMWRPSLPLSLSLLILV